LPVLYNKTSGFNPGGLVPLTTYFITNSTPTGFQLSGTSTGALNSVAITIASQTAAGGGVFTLTPLAMTGASGAGLRWQISNDSVTWSNLSISSVSITSSTLLNQTTYWDMGIIPARWFKLDISSAAAGAYSLKAYINGKTQ
jgi:hypothetical protein